MSKHLAVSHSWAAAQGRQPRPRTFFFFLFFFCSLPQGLESSQWYDWKLKKLSSFLCKISLSVHRDMRAGSFSVRSCNAALCPGAGVRSPETQGEKLHARTKRIRIVRPRELNSRSTVMVGGASVDSFIHSANIYGKGTQVGCATLVLTAGEVVLSGRGGQC